MKIPFPVIVCWLYAIWWLVVGIREYYLIMYMTAGSARYRAMRPLVICILAFLDLGLLGYFVLLGHRPFILLFLFVFTVIWIVWSRVVTKLEREKRY